MNLANPKASAVAGVVQVIAEKSEKTPPSGVARATKSVEAGSALLVGKEVVPQVYAVAGDMVARRRMKVARNACISDCFCFKLCICNCQGLLYPSDSATNPI